MWCWWWDDKSQLSADIRPVQHLLLAIVQCTTSVTEIYLLYSIKPTTTGIYTACIQQKKRPNNISVNINIRRNLFHDFTAVTRSLKSAFFQEKYAFAVKFNKIHELPSISVHTVSLVKVPRLLLRYFFTQTLSIVCSNCKRVSKPKKTSDCKYMTTACLLTTYFHLQLKWQQMIDDTAAIARQDKTPFVSLNGYTTLG